MTSFHELAISRRSIRNFTDQDIPAEVIEEIIRTAVTAPSGCNSQCWNFVAIKNRTVIEELAHIVRDETAAFFARTGDEAWQKTGQNTGLSATLFTRANTVIAVFMTHMEYYNRSVTEYCTSLGMDYREMLDHFAWADVLSIGAAVQNLLLAAREKGIGSVWMNEPSLAGEAIRKHLGLGGENRFVSLVALGYPASQPGNKRYKPMSEVYRLIE